MKSLTRALLAGSLPLCVVFAAKSASAATNNFCTFSDVGPLQLNGNAAQAVVGNTILRVTPNLANQVGSAFLKTAVPFPAGTSFHSYIRARFSPNSAGADGISFILQNSNAAAAALGSNGGGIGYGGVLPSVEIEFDTFLNAGWDPNGNHIALMKNGDVTTHLAAANPIFPLTNGQGFSTWIDYDGATKQIQVFASLNTIKPNAALFSQSIDIAMILGGTAYVGFTSGTSTSANNHDILEWEFSTDGIPCKCEQDAACGGVVPACSATKEICVQCSATNTSACTGQTPICDVPNGKCVACVTNADCGGNAPICDLATKTCQPCKADADCASFPATPACALQGPQQGQCVMCTTDAQCGGLDPKCDPGTNTCVPCLTNADCGGFTPICDPNQHVCFPCQTDADCGGATPACQPSGMCGQCSSTNTSACSPPQELCDIPTGTCVSCESNQDCSGTKPICILVSHICGPCKTDADCKNSPDGPACSMGGVNQGACVPCTGDATCADPTPKCDVPSNQCVGCLSNMDCDGMTPACDMMSHTCVGCVDDSTCSGPTPVCEGPTETCAPCQVDYAPNHPPLSCPTPDKPACEKMGPLAGHCVQCDSTNVMACVPAKTPVCLPAQDLCGCAKDTDCPVDDYCDTTKVTTGTCAPGCRVVNGMDHCATGEKCSHQDGSVGVCEPSGTGGGGPGGGGPGGGGPGSGGQGGAGHSGSGGSGQGYGVAGEGGGCSCGIAGEEGDAGRALWACAALGALVAGRRRRRR